MDLFIHPSSLFVGELRLGQKLTTHLVTIDVNKVVALREPFGEKTFPGARSTNKD